MPRKQTIVPISMQTVRSVNVCADKGDIGVAYTIARLTELKWNVGILLTEHSRYDLLAEKQGKCVRVQVKYVRASKNKGRIEIRFVSKWRNNSGTKRIVRQNGDFDILAVYCPDTKEVYFIEERSFLNNSTGITLRLTETSKKNGRLVRMARDFLEI